MMKMMMFLCEKEVCVLCAGFLLIVVECERLICREGGGGIARAQEEQRREIVCVSSEFLALQLDLSLRPCYHVG